MNRLSRREFLKNLGAALGLAAVAPADLFAQTRVFEFLVAGDSLVWGQGLEEKDKFYSLTAEWLRSNVFNRQREVNLKVKAHSGSTLTFHADEAEKYKRAGRDETYYYKPEVNVAFPSIWKQIEVAADEYKAAGRAGADLIMLTGGITDITVSKVLDPYGDNAKLPPLIEKYCGDDMFKLLEHAGRHNPDALMAVVGYFPMLSPMTSTSKLFNSWLESMSFPRFLKPLANNPIGRSLVFKRLRRKGIARSRIWIDESNKNFQVAVDRFNAGSQRARALFISSPLTEDNALEAPNTLLFRMGKNGAVEDPLYQTRKTECREALPELKRSTNIEYPVRLCEIAAVGHPNPVGSRAYAAAIKAALAPIIQGRAQVVGQFEM